MREKLSQIGNPCYKGWPQERVAQIIAERVERKLDFSRKLLLSAAGLLAVATPVVFGVVHATVSQAQSAAKSTAPDISGTWQGTLLAGRGLRIVIKISKADGGGWKAVMYSIDQGGQPITVTSITLEGSAVNFSIKGLDLTYLGTLNPDGNSIAGGSTQNGQTLALNLERVAEEDAWAIPEPPKPMAADADPTYEVVTIKPSDPSEQGRQWGQSGRHVFMRNATVAGLLQIAYGLHAKQIVGAPGWIFTDKFDIDGVPDTEGQASQEQMTTMFRKLLASRFQLKDHVEKRELAVYAITVAKGGPKMTVSATGQEGPRGFGLRGLGVLTVMNETMVDFANGMQRAVTDKPVVDQTGLKDKYDFVLTWTPDESQFGGLGIRVPPPRDDPNAPPSLYTAIQEQLGLKLEPTKAPVDVLVIDHVEKPSPN